MGGGGCRCRFTQQYIETMVSTPVRDVGLGYMTTDSHKLGMVIQAWGIQQLVAACVTT